MFRRANGDRGGSGATGFGAASGERLSLKLAMDLRRFASSARVARSDSRVGSGGERARGHVFMWACVVATCSSLDDKLLLPRASQVAQRPSSIMSGHRAVDTVPARPLSVSRFQRT